MTVHFISVGVSLLTALAKPRTTPALRTRKELSDAIHAAQKRCLLEAAGVPTPPPDDVRRRPDQQAREMASGWLAATLNPPGDPAARELIGRCGEEMRLSQWPAGLSAELGTFDQVPSGRLPLHTKDTAILIASDTPEGLVAALWNAAKLTDGDLDRLRYLDGTSVPPSPPHLTGRVVIARIPGMDAGTQQGFVRAMRGIGTLGRHLLRTVALQPLAFYLSGGYKAAIPYLIGLAEGMRGLPDAGPVTAYVLHETTDTPITLPLRTLTPEWVRQELDGFDAEGRRQHQPPGPGLLRGYAYEKVAEHWELTPFGAGLHALYTLDRPSAEEGLLRW